jgi:hypothetical protein
MDLRELIIYIIALAVPIVNSDTGEYIGIVGAEIPTEAFFAHYGNIVDIDSQFIVSYDSKFNYIDTPLTHFLGKNFFYNEVQKFFNFNNIQNDYYRKVFSGELSDDNAVYDFGSGERLNTGSSILLHEKPIYFIFIITATVGVLVEVPVMLSRTNYEKEKSKIPI